tara:strand:+ start:461 stop:685 length:225 start_codon:yes stop_codon:yes gene_type:complete
MVWRGEKVASLALKASRVKKVASLGWTDAKEESASLLEPKVSRVGMALKSKAANQSPGCGWECWGELLVEWWVY